jgi:hypothetical protein
LRVINDGPAFGRAIKIVTPAIEISRIGISISIQLKNKVRRIKGDARAHVIVKASSAPHG